ncbi:lycopene cyclase family protein [soil metagenome]
MHTHYDYIITGAGCAGLSLLYRMMQQDFFENKKILVIDQAPKKNNDRTWCFWEASEGVFEKIVHHSWKQIDFFSSNFSARFDIVPYTYKMIRGIDFYQYVLNEANQHSNIHFEYGNVKAIVNGENNIAKVFFEDKTYTCDYIFNSIILQQHGADKIKSKYYYLQQHFKGWLIETPTAIFNDAVATFMDFRVSQQKGTSFIYMLPVAPNKALVEYTLFSPAILPQYEYEEVLKQYIKNTLNIDIFTILGEEFGSIPMTNFPFSEGDCAIVNIGTAGKQTKASSGFTFQFIQKHSDAIINAVIAGRDPHLHTAFTQKRFALYDSTLLNILHHKKMGGDKIFEVLFKKNPPQRILRFLDNETNLMEELKLMSTVPVDVFLPAAMNELFR